MQSWIKVEGGVNIEYREVEKLKGSGHWVLPYRIHVDNNWSLTESTYDWCTGGGTPGNPYIIENVTIDAQGLGSCIYIEDTTEYFIIQNCTLMNSKASPDATIMLYNADNGKVIDNNCTDNDGTGVYVYSSSNILVEDNNLVNNNVGITLSYCYNSIVSKNYIQDSNWHGIYLWDSDNNIITENEVNHNGYLWSDSYGIYISESGSPSYVDSINNTIKYNNVHDNRRTGIYINSCDNNTIFGNSIENNQEYGIYLDDSDDVNIIGNKINDNGYGCIANQSSINIKDEWNVCNDVVAPFTIDETGGGDFTWDQVSQFAWCSGSGSYSDPYLLTDLSIDAQSIGSCIVIETSFDKYFIISGCTVINGQASGSNAGIRLNDVHDGIITQNNIMNNYIGIYLDNAENITVSDNDLFDNLGQSIILYQSQQNYILDNDQYGSIYYGLLVNAFSNNNTIRGNTFRNNIGAVLHGDGIRVLDSGDNKIVYNLLINNSRGIKIEDNSHNNTVKQNIIQGNLKYGALVLADPRESHDNLFYLNNFSNPLGQNAYDNGTNTKWDNGSIGNYWNNYSGIDADDDIIGDSPHLIPGDGGGQDNFPIWSDGYDGPPIITINQPISYELFGTLAPTVDVTFTSPKLSATWYQLNGTIITSNYNWTGTLDQSVWNQVGNGTVTLIFYANNTVGKVGSNSVTVRKDIIAPVITIYTPHNNARFNTTAPSYLISISEKNLDSYYYILSWTGGESGHFIYVLSGSINQALWDTLPVGVYTLTIYANDTLGNLGSNSVTIYKESLSSSPKIPFGSFYLIVSIVSITLILASAKYKLKIKS